MNTSINGLIGCSALGLYCIPCKAPFGKQKNVRRHLKEKHFHVINAMAPAAIRNFLSSLENSTKPPINHYLIGPIKTGCECSVCFTFVPRIDNFSKHDKGCAGAPLQVSYRQTICGRHHILHATTATTGNIAPSPDFAGISCQLFPATRADFCHPPPNMVTPSIGLGESFVPTAPLNSTRNHPTQFITPFSPPISHTLHTPNRPSMALPAHTSTALSVALSTIGATNNSWTGPPPLVFTNSVATEIIRPFVPYDEKPEVWSVHFSRLMDGSIGPHNFVSRIRQLILLWSLELDETDGMYLPAFLSLGQLWLDCYASHHIKQVQGNIRNGLIVFDAHQFGGSMYGGAFYLRKTDGKLGMEFRKLVIFCWRFKSTYLDVVKQWFQMLVDTNHTPEEMIGLGVFQIFLVLVCLQESMLQAHGPPLAIQFALSRCFHAEGSTPSKQTEN